MDQIDNPQIEDLSMKLPSQHLYRILVVDDDESLQIYMKKVLEDYYDVIQATTAGQAFKSIHDNHIDLVLLDLMLPAISGISICRQIKDNWKDRCTPVIVLTARTDLETKIEALEAGADDYITKPFHQKELLTRIKVQLRIKDLQQELVKTERLKAIVETAISANHEINNPLCAIINNTELAKSLPSIKEDQQAKTLLDRVFASALKIEKTIQKMTNIIQPAVSDYLPGIPMLDLTKSKAKDLSEKSEEP